MSARKFRELITCKTCEGTTRDPKWAGCRCESCQDGLVPTEPITLEELTEQAVKDLKAAFLQQLQPIVKQWSGNWKDLQDLKCIIDYLQPPKPPTPKEIINEVVRANMGDEILEALASKGWKVVES